MSQPNQPTIPVIVGPTAVGKTYLGIQLAKHANGEIISADSMQIYQHMNIGTAKPDSNEMQEIPHHLMDFVLPDQRFTVADFQELALQKIDELIKKNVLPIIVGGTGLYVHSLLYDMDFTEKEIDEALRSQLEKTYREEGSHALHQQLVALNPAIASRIHPNNWKRIIRAIEVCSASTAGMKDFSKDLKHREGYRFKVFGLYQDRSILYRSINERVDLMLENGLEEEVRHLLDSGFDPSIPALKGVGYKEFIRYFNHHYGYEECVELIKRNTRRFAKRQLTWFRKLPDVTWFYLEGLQPEKRKKELQTISNTILTELKGMVDDEKQR